MKTKRLLMGLAAAGPLAVAVAGCFGSPDAAESEGAVDELPFESTPSSWGQCKAVAVANFSTFFPYCQITSYCGLFGGKATLISGPADNPPCACVCK